MKVAYLGEDDRALNEVTGFLFRCAMQSAGHMTDYYIDFGTAQMMGGSNWRNVTDAAVKAGLLTAETEPDGAPRWKLIEDTDFLHIRLREEVEWDRQQARDSRDTKLTSAVRHRDGDACRYCGQIVYFGDKKSGRRGTYDHRGDTGQPGTLETLVVACGSCNSGRRDYDDRDNRYPLLPAPPAPHYRQSTVTWLAKHGYTVKANEPTNPTKPHHTGPATEATPGQATETTGPNPGLTSEATPGQATAPGATATDSPNPADHLPTKSGYVGTGLDGAGRAGTGQAVSPAQPITKLSPPSKRSRRGRPRSRGRN
ncbi:hypothetical protein [Pseudarthrobacter sp. ATCC 49987]|uniref:hypothetical protein n=1 Tax=Pseudarthrobacter sp. ATCC 49987 TaxID=2698204 RepID=UPI0013708A34|nr:hypothetical protein [Pseudarthrobacter sp. ATCC 49987]